MTRRVGEPSMARLTVPGPDGADSHRRMVALVINGLRA